MSLSVEIRNDIAFRKTLRLTKKTVFYPATTKLWNVHVRGLDMTTFNFDEAKKIITLATLTGISVVEIINDIHSNYSGVILEDLDETELFISQCKIKLGNKNDIKTACF